MRLLVLCQQPWGGHLPNTNLRAGLKLRQEALTQQKLVRRREDWRNWEKQAEAEAEQRRKEAEEKFRWRQVDGAALAAQQLEAYRAASQRAQQEQQKLKGKLDDMRAELQARVQERQRQQGNILPDSYGRRVVAAQHARVQQQKQQQQRQEQQRQEQRRQQPPPSLQGPSQGAWDVPPGDQVQGEVSRFSRVVTEVQRSWNGADPYRSQRPRVPAARRPGGAGVVKRQQQAEWGHDAQQAQHQGTALGQGGVVPAAAPHSTGVVPTAWAGGAAAAEGGSGWGYEAVPAVAYQQAPDAETRGGEGYGTWSTPVASAPIPEQQVGAGWQEQQPAATAPSAVAVVAWPAASQPPQQQQHTHGQASTVGAARAVVSAASWPLQPPPAGFPYGTNAGAELLGRDVSSASGVVEVKEYLVKRDPPASAVEGGLGGSGDSAAVRDRGVGGALQSLEYLEW